MIPPVFQLPSRPPDGFVAHPEVDGVGRLVVLNVAHDLERDADLAPDAIAEGRLVNAANWPRSPSNVYSQMRCGLSGEKELTTPLKKSSAPSAKKPMKNVQRKT